jgi:cytochrome P450
MTEPADPREGSQFYLDVPEKLDDPFPDLHWFLEHRPVFFHPPLNQWFVFKYDDVAALFADPRMSADRMKGFTEAAPEGLIAERRTHPRDDVLGTLVAAAGSEFTDDEIVANTMLIMLGGHVAVRNLIGNAVWLLLTHPAERARLQADPALLHGAIEETLRYETPVTMIPRIPLEDVEVRGVRIPAGAIVQLAIVAANRDPERFTDPDRFDIGRHEAHILSFGTGPHRCIGAGLAMEEARIALETLFRRMPALRLDESRPINWYRNAGNRGPINLPVTF